MPHTEAHPSYQIGQRAGHWLNNQFGRAGQFLNDWQHRVGFRRRNYVIVAVLLSLLFYFLYDLLRLL
ncbi:hypothetical protein [uncultured Fibrella sp.]|uniref:hypothetical protein n=1 Tax=uncultured Fibrella sp. TaxID=1284596 RepID=UPI0035CB33FC